MTMRQRKRALSYRPRRWYIRHPFLASGVWTAHEVLSIRRDPWSIFR